VKIKVPSTPDLECCGNSVVEASWLSAYREA